METFRLCFGFGDTPFAGLPILSCFGNPGTYVECSQAPVQNSLRMVASALEIRHGLCPGLTWGGRNELFKDGIHSKSHPLCVDIGLVRIRRVAVDLCVEPES